jgi:tetratricopeptide (TPR) repeat protein
MIGFPMPVAVGQQPEGVTEPPVPSTEQLPASSAMTVDEAIHAAIEVLDKLQAGEDSDTKASLLEEFDRLAGIVRDTAPDNPWLHYLYGRLQALTGRQGDAIDLLRKFIETREGRNEWRAHRLLGDLFVGDFPRLAKANYRRALALNENEPTVLFGLSRCAAKVGEYPEAIRLAEETVTADGRKTIRYLNHLARLLTRTQQWAPAKREAQAALRLADQAVEARPGEQTPLEALDAQYELLADICAGQANETPEAIEPYLETARYLRARGELAVKINLFPILDILQTAIEQTGPNPAPELIEEYAKTLAQLGRKDSAIAEFEKLLAVDPSNPVAAEWLHRLREPQPDTAPPPDP